MNLALYGSGSFSENSEFESKEFLIDYASLTYKFKKYHTLTLGQQKNVLQISDIVIDEALYPTGISYVFEKGNYAIVLANYILNTADDVSFFAIQGRYNFKNTNISLSFYRYVNAVSRVSQNGYPINRNSAQIF